MKTAKRLILLSISLLCLCLPFPAHASSDQKTLTNEYKEYRKRLEAVDTKKEISKNGFEIIKKQVFPVTMEGIGEVSFIPALDEEYHRLVLFFAKKSGEIVYKTDQLEANSQCRGELSQPTDRVAAVSFQDMNGDGLTDIVLITTSVTKSGDYAGRPYKVGDVLFQKEGSFYRDYRLSDKLNRFGMNKSIKFITSFIRDGYSTEFLYTAGTVEELLDHGFKIKTELSYTRQFEKLGKLLVVPGTYRMAEYTVFMVYLVNDQGNIVWSLQPMGDFEHLYGLRGITCQDIDGDGLKDIMILASYSYEGTDGQSVVEKDYSVYYQRTAGFYEDTDMKNTVLCTEEDTMTDLVDKTRDYWGWKTEQ